MATDPYIIVMFRGDSYPVPFVVKNKKTKTPIDLAGATAKLTVDRKARPVDETTKVFSVNGVIDPVPTTGRISFTPTPANTAEIGKYFYDIQLTLPDGSIRTIVKSTFEITQDITK